VEFVKKLASALFDWIWNAFRGLMNSVLKPISDGIQSWINNLVDIIKKYFENVAGDFIRPTGRLNSDNWVDWTKFISETLTWILLPITILTTILIVLNVIEIGCKAISFGLSDLVGCVGTFLVSIIISALGMGTFECILNVVDPSADTFMTIAPIFDTILGTISNLMSGIGLFFIEYKERGTLWRSAPIAILALFITAFSGIVTQGYLLLIIDIITIILTILAVYLYFKPLEKALKTLAPITSAFSDGLGMIAWGLDPLTVASHYDDWWIN